MSEDSVMVVPFILSGIVSRDFSNPLSLPVVERRSRIVYSHDEDEFVVSPIDQFRSDLIESLARDFAKSRLSAHFLDGFNSAFDYLGFVQAQATDTSMVVATKALTFASVNRGEAFKPNQLTLPIAGDFSPSKRLVEIWQASVLAMAQEAGVDAGAASELDAAQEFAKTLKAFIGSMGQEYRFSRDAVKVAISENHRFLPSVQVALCDQFLIVPDKSGEFLGLLYAELKSSLQEGIIVRGAWGSLKTDSDELAYYLAAPDFVSTPGFKKAREIR